MDFVLQPKEIAIGKGKNFRILLIHTIMQAVPSLIILLFIAQYLVSALTPLDIFLLFLIDFTAHTVIDYITSRIYIRKGYCICVTIMSAFAAKSWIDNSRSWTISFIANSS